MRKYTVHLAAICTLIGLLASCNKDRKNQRSSFYINGKEYATKAFQAYVLNGTPKIVYKKGSDNDLIQVSLFFNLPYFPKAGNFDLIRHGGSLDNQVGIEVLYQNKTYYASSTSSSIVIASDSKGKGKYEIRNRWLRNEIIDPTGQFFVPGEDSIQFSGTLFEPEDLVIR